jgi:hypothetical protein
MLRPTVVESRVDAASRLCTQYAVSPDRALYLPTFSHFLIVNKTSLSLSLSLSLSQ